MEQCKKNQCSTQFEDTIKKYLDEFATKDSEFARKYANEKKSITECCNYIIDIVRQSGKNGFADEEVFGMAVHYYDEENVTVGKLSNCKVVVNHEVELTEEEKEQLREKARKQVIEETKKQMTERKQPAKKESNKEEAQQLSLFDL